MVRRTNDDLAHFRFIVGNNAYGETILIGGIETFDVGGDGLGGKDGEVAVAQVSDMGLDPVVKSLWKAIADQT